jgi:radical SAM superfamily enzyme YgiQ (UPF0313 family)
MSHLHPKKVLILTGSLITANESSVLSALKKVVLKTHHSKAHWLETKIQALTAELWLMQQFYFGKKSNSIKNYLKSNGKEYIPELTEVVLATLLEKDNIEWEAMPFDWLFSKQKKAKELLAECGIVFLSTTFLHDLSELVPLLKKVKRPGNRIIVGGSLTKSLQAEVARLNTVDILAVGYGEIIVPYLCQWINSEFQSFAKQDNITIEKNQKTTIVKAVPPRSKNLDFLIRPDWQLIEDYHDTNYKTIYYESVRGCPYRCLFCNYPFLFNDKTFRKKSASKIVEDWEYYVKESDVETIICLDSLFTMPKDRLMDICHRIIEKKLHVNWICYARADDLLDLDTVKLMRKAGAIQVQIGAESGSQGQLNRMNKRCTVENNITAIKNCRKAGITSLVSLIIGYPGETEETIEKSIDFMEEARPDFYFLAPFSVRVEDVPVMTPTFKEEFELSSLDSSYTFAPYWKHYSMDCSEIGPYIRRMHETIIQEKWSLEGTLFYRNIQKYRPEMKEELMDYQARMYRKGKLLRNAFDHIHSFIYKKLDRDLHQRALKFN